MCLEFGLNLLILLRLVGPPRTTADESKLTCCRMTHSVEKTSKKPQPIVDLALMKAHVPITEPAQFRQAQSLSDELGSHCLTREMGARPVVAAADH